MRILYIIYMWSLFCLVQVYISLNFPTILLVKLGVRLSVFWLLVFLYFWVLAFSFSLLCFEFNFISKNLITFL